MKSLGFIIVAVLLSVSATLLNTTNTYAECKLPGDKHNDNKPSGKEGKELINSGAGVCEIAKKCDSMEIKVTIDGKKTLHEKSFYLNAPAKIQKELDEYVEHGSGHDNPNIVCYEVEESVKGD